MASDIKEKYTKLVEIRKNLRENGGFMNRAFNSFITPARDESDDNLLKKCLDVLKLHLGNHVMCHDLMIPHLLSQVCAIDFLSALINGSDNDLKRLYAEKIRKLTEDKKYKYHHLLSLFGQHSTNRCKTLLNDIHIPKEYSLQLADLFRETGAESRILAQQLQENNALKHRLSEIDIANQRMARELEQLRTERLLYTTGQDKSTFVTKVATEVLKGLNQPVSGSGSSSSSKSGVGSGSGSGSGIDNKTASGFSESVKGSSQNYFVLISKNQPIIGPIPKFILPYHTLMNIQEQPEVDIELQEQPEVANRLKKHHRVAIRRNYFELISKNQTIIGAIPTFILPYYTLFKIEKDSNKEIM